MTTANKLMRLRLVAGLSGMCDVASQKATVVNRAFSFSNLFGLGRCLYVLLCIFLLEKEKIYLFNREVDNSCERPRDRDR